MMTAELREAARALYEAHAVALGVDPWRPGGWRDEAPSPKQRRTLATVAGSSLSQLTEDDAAVVRAVATRPDAAGRGAVHDCLAVALGTFHAGQTKASAAVPAADAAALRLRLVAAVIGAPADQLERVARALGAA